MLKFFSILFLCGITFAQVSKASFVKEVEVESKYIVWSGYVVDSAYLNVWLPNGDLPRRANGTYLYWKADANGNLMPRRKIDYRLPIFSDAPTMMKKENDVFNDEATDER